MKIDESTKFKYQLIVTVFIIIAFFSYIYYKSQIITIDCSTRRITENELRDLAIKKGLEPNLKIIRETVEWNNNLPKCSDL